VPPLFCCRVIGAAPTELVWIGSGSASNDHTNGRRIVSVARVVHLRAVRKDGEHVTLGTQFDVMSGLRRPGVDAGFADVVDGHAHEKVDVAYDVALVEVELRQDRGEIVVAGLCGLDAIAQLIVGSAAASVNRIVAAEVSAATVKSAFPESA